MLINKLILADYRVYKSRLCTSKPCLQIWQPIWLAVRNWIASGISEHKMESFRYTVCSWSVVPAINVSFHNRIKSDSLTAAHWPSIPHIPCSSWHLPSMCSAGIRSSSGRYASFSTPAIVVAAAVACCCCATAFPAVGVAVAVSWSALSLREPRKLLRRNSFCWAMRSSSSRRRRNCSYKKQSERLHMRERARQIGKRERVSLWSAELWGFSCST